MSVLPPVQGQAPSEKSNANDLRARNVDVQSLTHLVETPLGTASEFLVGPMKPKPANASIRKSMPRDAQAVLRRAFPEV